MTPAAETLQGALHEARLGLIRGDVSGLDTATAAIANAESALHDLHSASLDELTSIQRAVHRLERLLEGIAGFYEGLARLRSVVDDAVANYTRDGVASPRPATNPSVSASG